MHLRNLFKILGASLASLFVAIRPQPAPSITREIQKLDQEFLKRMQDSVLGDVLEELRRTAGIPTPTLSREFYRSEWGVDPERYEAEKEFARQLGSYRC